MRSNHRQLGRSHRPPASRLWWAFAIVVSMIVASCGGGASTPAAVDSSVVPTVVRVSSPPATSDPAVIDGDAPGTTAAGTEYPSTTTSPAATTGVPDTTATSPATTADPGTTSASSEATTSTDPDTSVTTTSSAATTSSTKAPAPTTTKAPKATDEPEDRLARGDEGPAVEALQARLAELGYWLGNITGRFNASTEHAVTALQKVAGLDRNGIVGPKTSAALEAGIRPVARSSSGFVVEIDLTHQVLLLVRDGSVEWILDTSTGRAGFRTPPGEFEISKQIDASNVAGAYRPKYFLPSKGLSIHGYKSVPSTPFSHGCARVTIKAMDWIWARGEVTIGTPVWIYKG